MVLEADEDTGAVVELGTLIGRISFLLGAVDPPPLLLPTGGFQGCSMGYSKGLIRSRLFICTREKLNLSLLNPCDGRGGCCADCAGSRECGAYLPASDISPGTLGIMSDDVIISPPESIMSTR